MDCNITLPIELNKPSEIKPLTSYSFNESQSLRKEAIWQNLATITISEAISTWLTTLTRLTAKNYTSGMKRLAELKLINPGLSLQAFSLANHNAVIDRIKTLPGLSECSKQARAACYISFTRFLDRRTRGMIHKATPSREGTSKTFYLVREKVATQALSRAQWLSFLQELGQMNSRDCLIAKIILQGGKRVGEVLSLRTDMIDYSAREISFMQSKTKGFEKETVITYPQALMDELRTYIDNRQGIVFATKNNQPVVRNQLAVTFKKAGERAGISFRVTPHVLRASAVTYLKREGFSDSDIIKVTGHASTTMMNAYDKSERAQNASKKVSLI